MTSNREHDDDHASIRSRLDDWEFDPEQRVDILRDTLILHFGAFHGWTVATRGEVFGLVPMLVEHDREHRSSDVLEVEQFLDTALLEGIRRTENEVP